MKKILIVDDDQPTRLILVHIVESMGHVAFQCPDGKHALETLKSNSDIAMVITDMSMPRMDGRKLIEAVQSEERWNALPILIMSAVVGVKEISDLLKAGARAFLKKPVRGEEIREYIERYISSS